MLDKNKSQKDLLRVIGAFFFYFSDIMVGLNIIYDMHIFIILTWATYPLALVFLSLGNRSIEIIYLTDGR